MCIDFHTITCNNNELVIFRDFMGDHIWKSCDDLLFRREVGTLLEFKITNGTRQSQVTVDSSKVNESTCSTYSSLLAWFKISVAWNVRNKDIPSF